MARSPRSRIRERLDVRRLGVAVSYPGIDPRVWLAYARVDDDADAVRWDSALGWIADVTILGGGSDQEGPIACRLGQRVVGDQHGDSVPLEGGELCVVAIPEGNLNAAPVIVAVLSTADLPMPASVNGIDIDEGFAKANLILVTEHSVQQEVGERWRTSATERATLEAPEVRLAAEDADQAFVKGNDQASALKNLVDGLDAFFQALVPPAATPAPPNGALTVATVAAAYLILAPKLVAAKQAIDNALSTKIKGE